VPAISVADFVYGSLPSVQSVIRKIEAPAAASASGLSSLGTIMAGSASTGITSMW
jgi:hypothetical protein